jgi:hypothetical protein
MNDEVSSMMVEMEQYFDPMLAAAAAMFKKMSTHPDLWKNVAECMNVSVDAFSKVGFGRSEAINMAIAAMNSIGKK